MPMPAIQEISESLIREHISRAVSDVFQTMIGHPAQLSGDFHQGAGDGWPPHHLEADLVASPQVVGTVGFLGEANGLIYLYFDLQFARRCTCQMLSMSEQELDEAGDEVINDAIGEMTNMTVGGFKNGLCDNGYACKLTIPSILRGSNFTIEPISSAQRHIYRFESGGHRIVADILMKVGD